MRSAPQEKGRPGVSVAWAGGGQIQTVSTDHCSFTTEQKALGKKDFTKIPGGMPGVETRGTLLYTYGVDADG